MDTVAVTIIPDWFSTNAALVAPSIYGSSVTHTLRLITPEVAASIGRSLIEMPSDPVTMFTHAGNHGLRDKRGEQAYIYISLFLFRCNR